MEKVKDNVQRTTGNEDPEGEYELELYSFLNLSPRWGGGGWSTPRLCRFTPGKKTRYPLHIRLRGSQGRSRLVWEISPPPEFDPRIFQSVASHYTDLATPAHDVSYSHLLLASLI